MKIHFVNQFGETVATPIPSEKEIKEYLKDRLFRLRRDPDYCPKVLLDLDAEMVYGLELMLFGQTDEKVCF